MTLTTLIRKLEEAKASELIERVRVARSGFEAAAEQSELAIDIAGFVLDNRLDAADIFRALNGHLHEAIYLVTKRLPGWIYKVCRCHVSDDAWLCPDYNDPAHRERLISELGEPEAGSPFDSGIDVELRPPHGPYPARALLMAIIEAVALLKAKDASAQTKSEPAAMLSASEIKE